MAPSLFPAYAAPDPADMGSGIPLLPLTRIHTMAVPKGPSQNHCANIKGLALPQLACGFALWTSCQEELGLELPPSVPLTGTT